MNALQKLPRIAVLLLMAVYACGGGGASASATAPVTTKPAVPPAGTPNSIVVTNNAFTPADLPVATGSKVTWTFDTCNNGDGYGGAKTCVSHDITFDDGQKSGTLSDGTFSRTFSAAGTYAYHCTIHGAGVMSGRVVVQ